MFVCNINYVNSSSQVYLPMYPISSEINDI